MAEVCPSLWTRLFSSGSRNGNGQAAYAAATWLQRADMNGALSQFLNPPLEPEERTLVVTVAVAHFPCILPDFLLAF